MGISGLVGLLGEGVELVNIDGTVRHGDDEFGRGSREGEGFGGELDGGEVAGLRQVVQVERGVPGCRHQEVVGGRIQDAAHAGGVSGEHGLGARVEV